MITQKPFLTVAVLTIVFSVPGSSAWAQQDCGILCDPCGNGSV